MKLIEVKSNWKNKDLRIEFMLGNTCNFNCWYCFPGSHEGTHRWGDFNLLVKNFTKLVNQYKSNGKKNIYLHIIGGEPTLWPDLGNFVVEMKKLGCIISMSTNGSRTIRWWKENAKYFDKVTLSCHHAEMDISHNIQVADILYENSCIVDASVLMDPGAWDKCVSIVEELKTSKYRWCIVASEVLHQKILYTQEQTTYLEDHIKRRPNIFWFLKNNKYYVDKIQVVFENGKSKKVLSNWIRLQKLNHFKGWNCNIGVDNIFITKEGTITGTCGAKLFGKPFYYSIYDEDFETNFNVKISSTICEADVCNCQAEINLKKFIPMVTV